MIKYILIFFLCFGLKAETIDRRKLPKKIKQQFIEVLKKHDDLHLAFFNYDKEKINIAALEMADLTRKVGISPIKKVLIKMYKDLQSFETTKGKKNNYNLYESVASGLVNIISEYNVGSDYNVYSCPMVKKKWVQNSKTLKRVHNPFAPEMPHCGQRDTDF